MDKREQLELAGKIHQFLLELTLEHGRDFIVIGGWAVHAYGAKEYSLDGDAMVSVLTHGALRDQYLVTPNPRRKNHHFQMPEGYDVDLYVERQHGLRVPFSELQEYATHRNGLFVPCVEHLIILKLDAIHDRGHTPKGENDREDLCRLLQYRVNDGRPLRCPILNDYLNEKDFDELKDMAIPSQALKSITISNHFEASKTALVFPKCPKRQTMHVNPEISLLQKEYNSKVPASSEVQDLGSLCQMQGWRYPVITNRPTRFGFHDLPDQNRIFIHVQDGLVVLPRALQPNPQLILEALAYVVGTYDARETALIFGRDPSESRSANAQTR